MDSVDITFSNFVNKLISLPHVLYFSVREPVMLQIISDDVLFLQDFLLQNPESDVCVNNHNQFRIDSKEKSVR